VGKGKAFSAAVQAMPAIFFQHLIIRTRREAAQCGFDEAANSGFKIQDSE